MPPRPVEIPRPSGAPLTICVDPPLDGETRAWALLVHAFPESRDGDAPGAAVHLARALNERGVGVLRLRLGTAEEGADAVDQVVAAAEWLVAERDAPQVLVGHAAGGAAVLRAAARIPSARAVATIGAPAGEEGGAVEDATAALEAALLVMHAPGDDVVPIGDAARIFLAATHPRSFVSLDDADHALSRERDSRYAGTVLAAWAERYLDAPETPTVEALAEEGVVTRTGDEGYRTEVRAGRHGFALDEPEAVGGHDTAATPYDHLAAALGACTGMTLRMYADRKGWPLEQVTVRLAHHRVHGEDERRCADAPVRIDRLERTVEMEGPLDDAQRERLLEIADRCPVHRTLDAGVRIVTRAADGDG